MKDKSFSITDKETIAEYKQALQRANEQLTKLREENAYVNDMLENAHNRSRLLEAENKMLKNNTGMRINGLDIAQQCAEIAENVAVPYEQYDQGLAGAFIAKQIKEKFGLEI